MKIYKPSKETILSILDFIEAREDEELWLYDGFVQNNQKLFNYLFANDLIYLRDATDGNYRSEFIKVAENLTTRWGITIMAALSERSGRPRTCRRNPANGTR
jgi:hypothetical protein